MGRCLSGDGTNEALVSRKDTQYEEDHDTVSQRTSWGDVYLGDGTNEALVSRKDTPDE